MPRKGNYFLAKLKGVTSMKTKTILFFLILIGSCQKQINNKSDPTTPYYSLRQYLYLNFEKLTAGPSLTAAIPTKLTYDPSDFGFTTIQITTSDSNKVDYDQTINSVSVSPAFPPGVSFIDSNICSFGSCQLDNFRIKPSSISKTVQPITTYTIKGCNVSGCINSDITIQIANASGNTVWGQNGFFTTSSSSAGSTGLNNPKGIALDSTGGMYVADSGNNRVLYFPVNSQTATRVYGQSGSFVTNIANNGGISANSLKSPSFVVVDSTDGLYITDTFNNRILYYTSGSTTASRVYGQGGVFTTDTLVFTPSATNLNFVTFSAGGSLALDSNNNLYVTEPARARVLVFPNGSTTSNRVYGQAGLFTSGQGDLNVNTLDNLKTPVSVFVTPSGTVYILDVRNGNSSDPSRILSYSGSQTTATESLILSNNLSFSGISANGICVDSAGGIYIPSDTTFSTKVEYYRSMKAKRPLYAFSPTSDFTTSQNTVFGAHSVKLDSAGNIYISQQTSNRIVRYNQ
jgi:sugar lactone lactonase YvrE